MTAKTLCLALLVCCHRYCGADDWPQWLGPQRDGVWRETGIVGKFPTGGPKILWRIPIGAGYSSPAISNGKVYVTDRQVSDPTKTPSNPFDRASIPGNERVLCLNETTGTLLWKHEYNCRYTVSSAAGPRVTPLVDSGKVFTLRAQCNLYCFAARTWKLTSSRYF